MVLAKPSSMQLTIATLNILGTADRWPERRPLIQAAFASVGPDVMALQEVEFDAGQDELIASTTSEPYAVFRAHEKPTFGNALLVRRELVEQRKGATVDARALDLGDDRAAVVVEMNGVLLVSAHLHWVPQEPETRRNQMRRLLDELANGTDRPTLIAGDLNATPDEPACQALREAGFRSAFAMANGREPEWTYPTPATPKDVAVRPPSCIDDIWVSPTVEVRTALTAFDEPTARNGKIYPSDHRGIVATLEI
jgi:endonuclease/exonuclease/phosphatase family metal-dependent hydrolase